MSNEVTVKISGLDELQKNMEGLAKDVKNKILRAALNAGADVVLEEMKANCPVEEGSGHDGFLRDHIKKSVSTKGDDVKGSVKIGPTKDTYPV